MPIGKKGFGFVRCNDGWEFFFGFRVVEETRLPRVGDKVDFLPRFQDPVPGKAPEIKRMRFSKLVPQERALLKDDLDDGRVRCPNCGKRVVPRIVTWRGKPEASYCPLCGSLLKQMMKESASFSGSILGLLVAATLTAVFVIAVAS